jgi:hypothetical protein
LDNCSTPHSQRKKPEHRIIPLTDWTGRDDEVHINTQSGSQWDGFRELYLTDWQASILTPSKGIGLINRPACTTTALRTPRLRTQMRLYGMGSIVNELHLIVGTDTPNVRIEWTERGGIVGRGILLDYLSWAQSQGINYSLVERHTISEKDLEAVAAAQSTEFRKGDILLIRSGFVKWHNEASDEERRNHTVNGTAWAGVEGTKESVGWLWNHHFSGDANVFEAWPCQDERYRELLPTKWGHQ